LGWPRRCRAGRRSCAKRAIRHAAITVATAGAHVLRFDYFGTGDSAGEMQEATLDIWHDDIRCGVQELKEVSGARRVTLVGLRLGALLGSRAAAALPDEIDRLVLWDPVLDGRTFLDEQFRACYLPRLFGRGPVPRPEAVGGGFEVLGYPLSARLVHDITHLDMRSFARELSSRAYALISGTFDDETKLRGALRSRQFDIPVRSFAGTPCWEPAWPETVAVIPAELIKQLVHVAS
jgi:uncharacterized protein